MKKIAVIGLGIIGGSICAALTKAGYVVDGTDLNEQNVCFAIEKGYIQAKAEDIAQYGTVFLAIPPEATVSALENTRFQDGAIVADICGVKFVAGPSEATALGNIAVQLISLGEVKDIKQAKAMIGAGGDVKEYAPEGVFKADYEKFIAVCEKAKNA